MKEQKGITLIALIITIIVMLILVGVTINVALNGGLFQKAKSAADGTQKQAEKEELMAAAFGTIDTKGDLQIKKIALESVLSQGWKIDDENTITDNNNQIWYTCTSPKGNIYYLNTTTGEIKETEPTHNLNQAFNWASVNLDGVDTSAIYSFVPDESMKYNIKFLDTGTFIVYYNGEEVERLDATNSENYTFADNKFSYESESFGHVILEVLQNGNIQATVDISPEPVIYIKKSITITPSSVEMANGGTQTLTLTATNIASDAVCTWSTESNLITLTGNNRTATVQVSQSGTGTATITATCDGATAICTITIVDPETLASVWWFNKGLTSSNVEYDKSFKGNGDDEIIISSSGGFTKYTVGGVDYLNNVSKAVLDDAENQEFWEKGWVKAQDDWFYWMNADIPAIYLVQFSTNNIYFYDNVEDINNISNNTLTETFTLQEN